MYTMKTSVLLYVVLVILITFCVCDESELVQVKIKQGLVSGKVERTFLTKQKYYTFRGIPYAKPPIKDLRFKPPISHQGWNDTYEAYDKKPTCFQFNMRMRLAAPIGMSGSEDCLYINIFTPKLDGVAPVIVFDYNDNFRSSFNSTDAYSPEFFIAEDIVVVTISYRIGLLGFFTTNDDVIPPNNGLKDFILGLNWIKKYINAFGGDPERVTLMGSRGGAVLADILLRTEKAKNLFSGVIMQSGTALETIFFESKSREKAFEIGKLLNVTSNDSVTLLKELQKLDVETLCNNEIEVLDADESNSQLSILPFAPIVDNYCWNGVLLDLPENNKIINDVPIMIGMNSREGLDLASHYLFDPKLVPEVDQEFLFLFPIRSNFRFDQESEIYKEAIKEITTFYFKEGFFYDANVLEFAVYFGDILQNYALNSAARKLSKEIKSSVFYYLFDFRGLLNENSNYLSRYSRYSLKPRGATIIDELCYLQLCSRIKKDYKKLLNLLSEQSEMKVLKKMVRLWANFAKSRNPTPKEDDVLKKFQWKPIDKENEDINYLHITKTLRMKTNPLGQREQFWNDFLAKYSKLAVNGVVQKKNTHDEL